MKKIGIMGGTFDPIHNGHLKIGEEAYRQFDLDSVLFMPAGVPFFKAGTNVSHQKDREAMTKLAISDTPYFSFSDMELLREGNTYTAQTLSILCDENPENQYYYIVGADSLNYMDYWFHPEIIFQKAVILVANRNTQTENELENKEKFLMEKYHGTIKNLSMDAMDISSTRIRQLIGGGQESVKSMVPPSVLEYIYQHHLYLSEEK